MEKRKPATFIDVAWFSKGSRLSLLVSKNITEGSLSELQSVWVFESDTSLVLDNRQLRLSTKVFTAAITWPSWLDISPRSLRSYSRKSSLSSYSLPGIGFTIRTTIERTSKTYPGTRTAIGTTTPCIGNFSPRLFDSKALQYLEFG
jgi:hypothetical protein